MSKQFDYWLDYDERPTSAGGRKDPARLLHDLITWKSSNLNGRDFEPLRDLYELVDNLESSPTAPSQAQVQTLERLIRRQVFNTSVQGIEIGTRSECGQLRAHVHQAELLRQDLVGRVVCILSSALQEQTNLEGIPGLDLSDRLREIDERSQALEHLMCATDSGDQRSALHAARSLVHSVLAIRPAVSRLAECLPEEQQQAFVHTPYAALDRIFGFLNGLPSETTDALAPAAPRTRSGQGTLARARHQTLSFGPEGSFHPTDPSRQSAGFANTRSTEATESVVAAPSKTSAAGTEARSRQDAAIEQGDSPERGSPSPAGPEISGPKGLPEILEAFRADRPDHPLATFAQKHLDTLQRAAEWTASLPEDRFLEEDPPRALLTELDNYVFGLGQIRAQDLTADSELELLAALLRSQGQARCGLLTRHGLEPFTPATALDEWQPGSSHLDVSGHTAGYLPRQDRKVSEVLSPGFHAGPKDRQRVVRRAMVKTYRLLPTPELLEWQPRRLDLPGPWTVLISGNNLSKVLEVSLEPGPETKGPGQASVVPTLRGNLVAATDSWLRVEFDSDARIRPGRYLICLKSDGSRLDLPEHPVEVQPRAGVTEPEMKAPIPPEARSAPAPVDRKPGAETHTDAAAVSTPLLTPRPKRGQVSSPIGPDAAPPVRPAVAAPPPRITKVRIRKNGRVDLVGEGLSQVSMVSIEAPFLDGNEATITTFAENRSPEVLMGRLDGSVADSATGEATVYLHMQSQEDKGSAEMGKPPGQPLGFKMEFGDGVGLIPPAETGS